MTINVFEPQLDLDELAALVPVVHSKWLGKGVYTEEFVARFAELQGVEPETLVPVSSCTDALFIAFEAISLDALPFGYVIMPSIHFVGAANAAYASKLRPKFCDVDYRSLNPTVDQINEKIDDNTVAVCLLHYGGVPTQDISFITDLCRSRQIYLIEDSACSMVSKREGKSCGTFGDIGMWSFDPMKLISCGDGGMMYVKNEGLRNTIKELCHFGLTNRSGMTSGDDRWWEFDVTCPGRYSTLNDVDSAILLTQMDKLEEFMYRRLQVYDFYRANLKDVGDLALPPTPSLIDVNSYYFFWVQTMKRNDLAKHLRDNDIYTTFRYHPLHLQTIYEQQKFYFPGATRAAATTLLLPMHAGLDEKDLTFICHKIKEFYDN